MEHKADLNRFTLCLKPKRQTQLCLHSNTEVPRQAAHASLAQLHWPCAIYQPSNHLRTDCPQFYLPHKRRIRTRSASLSKPDKENTKKTNIRGSWKLPVVRKATGEVDSSSSVRHANANLARRTPQRGKNRLVFFCREKRERCTETGSWKAELGWREKDRVTEGTDFHKVRRW